jgi:hypothetical protein
MHAGHIAVVLRSLLKSVMIREMRARTIRHRGEASLSNTARGLRRT